ncbi:MAG TPA: hypothetical protein VLN48_00085 [Bryobacteraceae bacterium]|nr:hypothetical protein [Bryobacteraceae bacterium]
MSRMLLLICSFAAILFAQLRSREFPPDIVPPEVLRGKDALAADPKHYKLELDNDRMRVLRLILKADETVPVHDDQDALFVCVKECHIRFTRPGGRPQDIHMQTGESRWIYGDTRSEKNLGTQPLEMLVIETK